LDKVVKSGEVGPGSRKPSAEILVRRRSSCALQTTMELEEQKRYFEIEIERISIPSVEDRQAQFLILNHCISFCRMVFFMRVSPPDQIEVASRNFDESVRTTFETILGMPLGDLQ
jgi:hypothetical protein